MSLQIKPQCQEEEGCEAIGSRVRPASRIKTCREYLSCTNVEPHGVTEEACGDLKMRPER